MRKLFILLFSLTTLMSCGNSEPSNSDVKDAARAAIIHSLKDPMSADFYFNDKIKKISDSNFIYTETVGATNSFGGKIVHNAIVKLRWAGGDPSEIENWRLIDIQFTKR